MEIFSNIAQLQNHCAQLRSQGLQLALIPTSGTLHPGHVSLIHKAKELGATTIVTNFINTLQFGPNEDPSKYPLDPSAVIQTCQSNNVDILFTPEKSAIYPPNFSTYIQESLLTKELAGPSRPHFFRGYATYIQILLNITHPHFLILGQKDIHQANLIKKIIADWFIPTQTILCPIIRDADGVAFSSTNSLLSSTQREDARKLNQALEQAKKMVNQGVRSVERVVAEVTHLLTQSRRLRVLYISIVNPSSMSPLRSIEPGNSLLTLSVWIDQIRLNDNSYL